MRAMKDSGIPWIGAIPKDWTIELIGNQVKEVNNPNTNGLEDNALQFKMGSIISKSRGDSKYNPETLEGYNIVDKGVIMLNGLNLSFDLISQRVGLVRERGVITSTYLAVKPSNNIDSEYLTYLFKAYDNCKAFHSMGRGLRQTLSYGELRKYLLLYPSLAEQQKIAEFLDRKCAEVDEMIALQEQIIEELKAYKQSVITEAVTKGLNPDVPMRDSGIEWIGQIPEHWEVKRLKNLATDKDSLIIDGDWIESDVIESDGIRYLTTGNIGVGVFKEQGQGYISEDTFKVLNCTMVYAGDLVFSRLNYPMGRSCIIPDKYTTCVVAVDNVVFRPNKDVVKKYLMYVSMCYGFQNENALIARGATMQRMSRSQLVKAFVPTPTPTEQQAIADYLDEKCADIDALIATKQQKIDSLKEYKKSIIYEYVTGKREVE